MSSSDQDEFVEEGQDYVLVDDDEDEYHEEDDDDDEGEQEEGDQVELQALLRLFLTRNVMRRDMAEEPEPEVVQEVEEGARRRKHEFQQESDLGKKFARKSTCPFNVATALNGVSVLNSWDKTHVLNQLLPAESQKLAELRHQFFSGKFSRDGELFAASSQDSIIRLFDTENDFKLVKSVQCNDVSWAVLDTDYSPDKRWLAYCTWSSRFHIVNTQGDVETHKGFELRPPSRGRFCLFSLRFSPDSSEICGGSCDESVYTYDLVAEKRTQRFEGHTNDVNAVCYLNDGSGNLIISGSDDTMVRVWDKREGKCVGAFAGHVGGVTSVDSRDSHYLISNSKDQSIKLWDVRKMGNGEMQPRFRQHLDYRMGGAQMRALLQRNMHTDDSSLMTYRGHSVLQTLIRAYFSPPSTGGKFIYTGSYDGVVRIYDVLSGETVRTLNGHRAAVRDVSWHPEIPSLASVSWDGSIRVAGPPGRSFLDTEEDDNDARFGFDEFSDDE